MLRWCQRFRCSLVIQLFPQAQTAVLQTIAMLDEEKKKALRLTWDKVNADFGSIFSTLLPGTNAKLEPPPGCDFLQGGCHQTPIAVSLFPQALWKVSCYTWMYSRAALLCRCALSLSSRIQSCTQMSCSTQGSIFCCMTGQ